MPAQARPLWIGRLVDNLNACPLCATPIMAKVSSLGLPFYSCGRCRSRMFINSEEAVELVLRRLEVIRRDRKAYENAVKESYMRFLSTLENAAAFADHPTLSKAAPRPGWLVEELGKRGRQCILCGGPATFKQGKKGHFHQCRLCYITLFMNDPLSWAGFSTRLKPANATP